MRVLLASPDHPDSFADNVRVTLEALGHEVISPLRRPGDRRRALFRTAVNEIVRHLGSDASLPDHRLLLRVARETKPDILLALTWVIPSEILREIGRTGARRVLWWGDPQGNAPRWGFLDEEWDHVFLKDRAAVAKAELAGVRAHFLPEAMNPIWHRPLAAEANEEVAIIGNSYGFRQALVRRLARQGVPIGLYGPEPPAWANKETKSLHRHRYIVRDEKSRVMGEARAVLNSFSPGEGNSLNSRAFEAAGAGALQLLEYREAVHECFVVGEEVLTFGTYEDLTDLLARVERDGPLRRKVRQRAAARALADHTYEKRLRLLLTTVER
jgi:spore maturation protein CgeB